MTEPTTPTGKRLHELADREAEQVLGAEQAEAWVADWWVTYSTIKADILAIEHEAAAAERERIKKAVEAEWYNGNITASARDRILHDIEAPSDD